MHKRNADRGDTMSEPMKTQVTCPKCQAAGKAEIWTNVNSAENPNEAQWLIDGFLFQYECPECGHVSTLNHDCLYHDAGNRAFILYVAEAFKAHDALAALEARAPKGYRVRLVDSREALREKAAILRDGLDDRAVEVAKLAAYNKFAEEGALDRSARAYYGALDEDGGIIVEFVSASGTTETTVPRDIYDGIAASFTDVEPSIVDRTWATQVLNLWK